MNPSKPFRPFAALALAALLAAPAGGYVAARAATQAATPASDVALAKKALQQAVDAGKPADMLAARAQFAVLAEASPDDARLHYWVALAGWRAIPILARDKSGEKQAEALCEDGVARCDRALKLDRKFAEAIALKVGIQGMSLQFDPGAAMTLGMVMEQEMARARDLAPDNPRVHLFDAINTLFKPEFVGGGADKALPRFERAIALFARAPAPADAADPDWGRDDAALWAGRAAMRLEDYARARDHFKAALAVNPSNGWVRTQLLPEAERKLAGGKEKS